MRNTAPTDAAQLEALETREWLGFAGRCPEALEGRRASEPCFVNSGIHAQKSGVRLPFTANTPYINTINADEQVPVSGQPRDRASASRASSAGTRWRWWCAANKIEDGIGGHISTFASSATFVRGGYNHFFRGRD
jgi:pyruvate dehydrogenase E1 component